MSTGLAAVIAGVIGAIFGSFLNVVAYRLPRGESLSHPRSRCPRCETPIKPYDNVPVLSWLALRGSCRACGARISARYPLVEAGTGVLCALVVIAKGPDEDALLGLALVLLLVPVTLIDLDHRIIPNSLMLIGAVVAPALVLLTAPDDLLEHVDRGRRRRRVLPRLRVRVPARNGHGGRQARRRPGAVPGTRRRPRGVHRARSPARLLARS